MRYSTKDGFYELNAFPGCNQIVVSNHAFIDPTKRGQGKGRQVHVKRLKHATELGYDYLISTVVATNVAQIKILKSTGWMKLDGFFNKETGHLVEIWGRSLEYPDLLPRP